MQSNINSRSVVITFILFFFGFILIGLASLSASEGTAMEKTAFIQNDKTNKAVSGA
ncbi:unnamed protein product [Coffea canephora]|uniref:DH200=94 genomic scaffold, scaffold_1184 n=1 Tax=Coffea canephora TaxID=49390 RepID=A0A068VI72_COFCA|nr:unnamed protein product [Coffea canephora]